MSRHERLTPPGGSASAAGAPSRRQVLAGAALLAVAVAGTALKPHRRIDLLGKHKLDPLVPQAFADWRYEPASGLILPPADQLRDAIYSQLVTRVYADGNGNRVMALIAYSAAQDGTVQVHRPEVCYPASGYRLTANRLHETPLMPGRSVPSRFIIAQSDLRSEALIYWTRVGGHFPTRWLEQRGAVMAENFGGAIPDGVLVRFSTEEGPAAAALLDRFAAAFYGAASTALRDVLVGQTMAAGSL